MQVIDNRSRLLTSIHFILYHREPDERSKSRRGILLQMITVIFVY